MDRQKIRQQLEAIYHRLRDSYGPQHWWPADEPFEVIVGAILTQSTAWSNVEKAIANLKAAGTMSAAALRDTPTAELAGIIRPSGYYNVKAQKLQALARWLGENCGDNLERLFARDTAVLRRQLLSIWGIGQETADSIILYAAGQPIFVIDAYTRRILGRTGLTPADADYASLQSLFMENLPADVGLFNEYHALLVNHGKHICRPKPLCSRCCLNTSGETGERSMNPCALSAASAGECLKRKSPN